MKTRFMIPLVFITVSSSAQNLEYFRSVFKADSLLFHKKYLAAGQSYSEAIDNTDIIVNEDYYNAVASYAQANKKDVAFKYLKVLAEKGRFNDLSIVEDDNNLNQLKKDARWNSVTAIIKANQAEAEKKYNLKVKTILDEVYKNDQQHRRLLNEAIKQYGIQSDQVNDLQSKISNDDEKNFSLVSQIIDKYGWLGSHKVGGKGEKALFLTIQHADNHPDDQVKYLKIFKQAIKSGISDEKADYAYLEDRVSIYLHKYQLYGTQLKLEKNGLLIPQPILDVRNVDKRRQPLGLPPLKYYLSSVNQYK
ncbi:DUF6624 domain-containing protein [Mucilaginibacter lappiensis]|uniref:DUF6624 domain-containing protein n=1 Tax=Mucilaginibacter lappiensis TaxID=354630 RepID=UPI003D1BC98C